MWRWRKKCEDIRLIGISFLFRVAMEKKGEDVRLIEISFLFSCGDGEKGEEASGWDIPRFQAQKCIM